MHVERSMTYPGHPMEVARVLLSEELARARAEEAGGPAPEHEVKDLTASTVVAIDHLPSPADKFIRGGATATIVQAFESEEDGQGMTGTVSVSTSLPVTVALDIRLTPEGENTRASLAGDLKVNVPFFGSKVEKMVEQKIDEVLARDAKLVEGLIR